MLIVRKKDLSSRGDFALSSYRERERGGVKGKLLEKRYLSYIFTNTKTLIRTCHYNNNNNRKKKGIDSISHFVNRKKRKGGDYFFFSGPKSGV